MDWIQALILGLIQGLTEYLPVSSSGHLAIGSYLFGIEGEENLAFTVAVHVATVLSTFVILWSEIDWIFRGLFKFKLNDETKYFLNIVVSMILCQTTHQGNHLLERRARDWLGASRCRDAGIVALG